MHFWIENSEFIYRWCLVCTEKEVFEFEEFSNKKWDYRLRSGWSLLGWFILRLFSETVALLTKHDIAENNPDNFRKIVCFLNDQTDLCIIYNISNKKYDMPNVPSGY